MSAALVPHPVVGALAHGLARSTKRHDRLSSETSESRIRSIYRVSVDGLRESRRGELGKELVGSHPSQDRLYHWFKSNDYGRILPDNSAHIKDKRMVCRSYRSEFEVIRNSCVPHE
jgi:hypothetical protein